MRQNFFSEGAIFVIKDGWGDSVDWHHVSGDIRIIMWNCPSNELVYTQTLSPFGIGVASTSYEVTFPSSYSLDDYLVTVEVCYFISLLRNLSIWIDMT